MTSEAEPAVDRDRRIQELHERESGAAGGDGGLFPMERRGFPK